MSPPLGLVDAEVGEVETRAYALLDDRRDPQHSCLADRTKKVILARSTCRNSEEASRALRKMQKRVILSAVEDVHLPDRVVGPIREDDLRHSEERLTAVHTHHGRRHAVPQLAVLARDRVDEDTLAHLAMPADHRVRPFRNRNPHVGEAYERCVAIGTENAGCGVRARLPERTTVLGRQLAGEHTVHDAAATTFVGDHREHHKALLNVLVAGARRSLGPAVDERARSRTDGRVEVTHHLTRRVRPRIPLANGKLASGRRTIRRDRTGLEDRLLSERVRHRLLGQRRGRHRTERDERQEETDHLKPLFLLIYLIVSTIGLGEIIHENGDLSI